KADRPPRQTFSGEEVVARVPLPPTPRDPEDDDAREVGDQDYDVQRGEMTHSDRLRGGRDAYGRRQVLPRGILLPPQRGGGHRAPPRPLAVLPHHVRFHRIVLGKAQAVYDRRRRHVPLLHTLPELAVVEPRERRLVLLRLVLEDRHDLLPQLLLGHGLQHVRLRHRPLLPRAAVVPDLRRRAGVALERPLDRFLAHAVRPVRVREVAR